jgi:hypothetical protein
MKVVKMWISNRTSLRKKNISADAVTKKVSFLVSERMIYQFHGFYSFEYENKQHIKLDVEGA